MLKEYWTQEREELVIDPLLFLEESCFQKYVITKWFNFKILLLPYMHCWKKNPWGVKM